MALKERATLLKSQGWVFKLVLHQHHAIKDKVFRLKLNTLGFIGTTVSFPNAEVEMIWFLRPVNTCYTLVTFHNYCWSERVDMSKLVFVFRLLRNMLPDSLRWQLGVFSGWEVNIKFLKNLIYPIIKEQWGARYRKLGVPEVSPLKIKFLCNHNSSLKSKLRVEIWCLYIKLNAKKVDISPSVIHWKMRLFPF